MDRGDVRRGGGVRRWRWVDKGDVKARWADRGDYVDRGDVRRKRWVDSGDMRSGRIVVMRRWIKVM